MTDFRRPPPAGAQARAASGACRAWLAVGLGLLVLQAAPVLGQRKPKGKTATQAPAPVPPEAQRLLAAEGRSEVQAGIELLGMTGTPEAARLLAARVRDGLPPDLLDLALDTLLVIGDPASVEVLLQLVEHRRPAVRSKAMQTLAGIATASPDSAGKGAGGGSNGIDTAPIVAAVSTGLADEDPGVRAAAARSLGELGDPRAKARLFTALERGVIEAAAALAQLVTSSDLPHLAAFVGRFSFQQLAPAMRAALERDGLAVDAKLQVIARIGELATPEAKRFLQELAAAHPSPADPVVRAAEAAAGLIQ